MAPLLVTKVHFGGENNISLFPGAQLSDQVAHLRAV